jgi:hypothetical protein
MAVTVAPSECDVASVLSRALLTVNTLPATEVTERISAPIRIRNVPCVGKDDALVTVKVVTTLLIAPFRVDAAEFASLSLWITITILLFLV